jgi:hypothetical protein
MRIVICPECKRDIEVRSGFAHFTLNRHLKEHDKVKSEPGGLNEH